MSDAVRIQYAARPDGKVYLATSSWPEVAEFFNIRPRVKHVLIRMANGHAFYRVKRVAPRVWEGVLEESWVDPA